MNAKLNKRERRAAQLLKHYETCERLGLHLGRKDPDGKKISIALWNLENQCHAAAVAYCNGERFHGCIFMQMPIAVDFGTDGCAAWEHIKTAAKNQIYRIFGTVPSGFFVNGDARGYAVKIDNENPAGQALIDAVQLHRDWGGYGILSPEITGEA